MFNSGQTFRIDMETPIFQITEENNQPKKDTEY